MTLWEIKYKPSKLSDLVGNKDTINKIKKWLINFNKEDSTNYIIISGDHSVGKKTIINLILNDLNYKIINIDSHELKNIEATNYLLKNKNKSITNMMKSDNRQTCIVIHNIDKISLKNEKKHLELLIENSENYKLFPIIMLTSLQHSKYTSKLKKNHTEFKIEKPSIDDIKKLLNKIIRKENIIFTEKILIDKIIIFSQRDIRKSINILQDLYNTYKNDVIDKDKLKKYKTYSQKKDVNINLFPACKELLDNFKNIDHCIDLYKTEKVLLPLMIHENYTRAITSLKGNNKIDIMKNIIDSLSKGDIVETDIYTDQNWYLQDIHGFLTCAKTSYYLNKNDKNEKYYDIIFTSDLNRTSLKNINKKKNIDILKETLVGKSLDDFMYLNILLSELVKNKKIDEIVKIMMENNLTIKDVEIIIKIDRTYDKVSLKTKEKKIISTLITNYTFFRDLYFKCDYINIANELVKNNYTIDKLLEYLNYYNINLSDKQKLLINNFIKTINKLNNLLNTNNISYNKLAKEIIDSNFKINDLDIINGKSSIIKHKKNILYEIVKDKSFEEINKIITYHNLSQDYIGLLKKMDKTHKLALW